MSLEKDILKAIRDLGPEPDGIAIRQHLEKPGGVSIGRLYSTLGVLQEEGFIIGEDRPGGVSRGGLPKRIYWLTGNGLAAIEGDELRQLSIRLAVAEISLEFAVTYSAMAVGAGIGHWFTPAIGLTHSCSGWTYHLTAPLFWAALLMLVVWRWRRRKERKA